MKRKKNIFNKKKKCNKTSLKGCDNFSPHFQRFSRVYVCDVYVCSWCGVGVEIDNDSAMFILLVFSNFPKEINIHYL